MELLETFPTVEEKNKEMTNENQLQDLKKNRTGINFE